MKSKSCFFFVDDMDSSFVENELQNLLANFEKVIVVTKAAVKRSEANIEVISLNHTEMKSLNNFISNLILIAKIYLGDVDFANISFNLNFIKYKLSSINRAVYLANLLSNNYNLGKNETYYSFWMNEWASVLAILKQKSKIEKFVTRVHGADLYEERVPIFNKLVLRKFQLQNVFKVFSISKKGAQYLKNKYEVFQNKIFTSYLGTNDCGLGHFDKSEKFTIVSCAKVRNIKRVYLFPEILKHIDFPIKWVHIGDENLNSSDATIPTYIKNVKELEGKSNVEVVRLGAMSNAEILNYYKENSVNLFVSVSETEGLPISMMEAISFGMPILSTDVGGCNEIVNEITGILIEKDFDPKAVAVKMLETKNSELNSLENRIAIKNYWQATFNSKTNFRFINIWWQHYNS